MTTNEKTEVAGLSLSVPTKLIEETVRAEIVRTLSKATGDRFVEEIVRQALAERGKNNYSRDSDFVVAFKNAIQDEARAVIKEWIAENRETIRKAFVSNLQRNKAKRLRELCDGLLDGMSKLYVNGVSLKLDDGADR